MISEGAGVLLAGLRAEASEVVGDLGYDSSKIRLFLAELNIAVCFSPERNRTSKRFYCRYLYKKRHHIGSMFAGVKAWRRIAAGYDGRACAVMAAIRAAEASYSV